MSRRDVRPTLCYAEKRAGNVVRQHPRRKGPGRGSVTGHVELIAARFGSVAGWSEMQMRHSMVQPRPKKRLLVDRRSFVMRSRVASCRRPLSLLRRPLRYAEIPLRANGQRIVKSTYPVVGTGFNTRERPPGAMERYSPSLCLAHTGCRRCCVVASLTIIISSRAPHFPGRSLFASPATDRRSGRASPQKSEAPWALMMESAVVGRGRLTRMAILITRNAHGSCPRFSQRRKMCFRRLEKWDAGWSVIGGWCKSTAARAGPGSHVCEVCDDTKACQEPFPLLCSTRQGRACVQAGRRRPSRLFRLHGRVVAGSGAHAASARDTEAHSRTCSGGGD